MKVRYENVNINSCLTTYVLGSFHTANIINVLMIPTIKCCVFYNYFDRVKTFKRAQNMENIQFLVIYPKV